MSIRTIGELIVELQRWPPTGLVDVGLRTTEVGSGNVVPIESVNGYAGGAIDGSDSGVTLTIRHLPTWHGSDTWRRRRRRR